MCGYFQALLNVDIVSDTEIYQVGLSVDLKAMLKRRLC